MDSRGAALVTLDGVSVAADALVGEKGQGGALLTFGLGTKQRAFAFIDAVSLALNQTNIGDAKTLVIHPASTIYHDFTLQQKQDAGVTEDLVRVSVGLEEYKDIEQDFEQALKQASEVVA